MAKDDPREALINSLMMAREQVAARVNPLSSRAQIATSNALSDTSFETATAAAVAAAGRYCCDDSRSANSNSNFARSC